MDIISLLRDTDTAKNLICNTVSLETLRILLRISAVCNNSEWLKNLITERYSVIESLVHRIRSIHFTNIMVDDTSCHYCDQGGGNTEDHLSMHLPPEANIGLITYDIYCSTCERHVNDIIGNLPQQIPDITLRIS